MINEFVCTNISTQDPAALVAFYHEKLGIPIVFEGYDNYDGAKLGFSEKAPGIIVWNNSKWGEASESKVEFVSRVILIWMRCTGNFKQREWRHQNLVWLSGADVN